MSSWVNRDTLLLYGVAAVGPFAILWVAFQIAGFFGRGKRSTALEQARGFQDPRDVSPPAGSLKLQGPAGFEDGVLKLELDPMDSVGVTNLRHALVGRVAEASFFSEELRGRLMANGKPCDPDALTCAMRLGRELRGSSYLIRSRTTKKGVVVELTDFGPASWTDCDIDLSSAAYRAIATEGEVLNGQMSVEIFLLRRISK